MGRTTEMDYRKLAFFGGVSLVSCWLTVVYVIGPSQLDPSMKRLVAAPFIVGIGLSMTAVIGGLLLWFMRWRAGD